MTAIVPPRVPGRSLARLGLDASWVASGAKKPRQLAAVPSSNLLGNFVGGGWSTRNIGSHPKMQSAQSDSTADVESERQRADMPHAQSVLQKGGGPTVASRQALSAPRPCLAALRHCPCPPRACWETLSKHIPEQGGGVLGPLCFLARAGPRPWRSPCRGSRSQATACHPPIPSPFSLARIQGTIKEPPEAHAHLMTLASPRAVG